MKDFDKYDGNEEQFIKDLFEEFKVSNKPYKDRMYSYAYREGHAYGYSEIYSVFADLVYIFEGSD